MKQIHIWAAVVCLLLASCSDIRFGDDFLGDHPESSGATLDEMFSSAVNADRVLTKAYTYLPYGLPTGRTGAAPYSTLPYLPSDRPQYRSRQLLILSPCFSLISSCLSVQIFLYNRYHFKYLR